MRRECMKLEDKKNSKSKTTKRNFAMQHTQYHTHSHFIQIRKSHGFEGQKSTSAESIHSPTKYTRNERKKRIYHFHLADSVHTHTQTHITHLYRIPNGNLFNTCSQCFFRLKCRSVSPSQSDMPQQGFFTLCFFGVVFHLVSILSLSISQLQATHEYDFMDSSAFRRIKAENRKIIE